MIRQYVVALQREIYSPTSLVMFEAARRRHEALAPYGSPSEVLAALSATSVVSSAGKDAITRSLVAEYQTSRGPLWHSLLVVAYMPMLRRLSHRIRASINDELERDHLVMVSFFKAIRVISPQRKWICLSLRRGVERRVFQHLRCERREQQRERPVGPAALEHRATRATAWLPDGDSLWPAMKTAEHADGCEGHEERAARAALLAQIARGVLDYEELELLLATLVRGKRLSDHVRRLYPDLDEVERQRVYQRLKRRHSRAIIKLRAHLERDQRRAAEDVGHDIRICIAAAEQGVDADVIEDVTFVEDDMPVDLMALVA